MIKLGKRWSIWYIFHDLQCLIVYLISCINSSNLKTANIFLNYRINMTGNPACQQLQTSFRNSKLPCSSVSGTSGLLKEIPLVNSKMTGHQLIENFFEWALSHLSWLRMRMKADRIQRNIGTGNGCILILKFRSLRSIGFLSRKIVFSWIL